MLLIFILLEEYTGSGRIMQHAGQQGFFYILFSFNMTLHMAGGTKLWPIWAKFHNYDIWEWLVWYFNCIARQEKEKPRRRRRRSCAI